MFKSKSALCFALVSVLSIGTATAAKPSTPATPATTTKVGTTSVQYFVVPNVSGAEPYAGKVSITQLASGTQWLLDLGFTKPDAKVLDLGFDYTGSRSLAATSVSGGGEVKKIYNNGLQFVGSNSSSFTAGETMTWQFVGTDLSQFSVNTLHIGNFLQNGGSIKYGVGAYTPPTSPVPEPSVYVMVLAGGLAVYVGSRRRKTIAAAASRSMALSPA